MHLEDHLKDKGITQGDFGKKLNPPASQGLISQWIRGVTRVTLEYALQIEKESDGAVTPKDCADMYLDPQQRSSSKPTTSVPNRRHDDPKVAA